MLAGTAQVSRGELIYTDYLYDDYGADLNGSPDMPSYRSDLSPTSGDYRYPDEPERYGHNAADLRELRIAADPDAMHLLIALQTMKQPDAAAVTIAVDTDGEESSGEGEWPGGIGLTTPGADRFITVWGGHARVEGDMPDGRSTELRVTADEQANAIEVEVPWESLGPLSDGARVWAASGLSAGGGRYLPQSGGETAAFDLAFQWDERFDLLSHWGDRRQSGALASGEVSEFHAKLDRPLLLSGSSEPFRPKSGFYNRIFRSDFSYGEGISLKQDEGVAGSAEPMFRGRYQPYGLYIPEGYWRRERSAPLLLDGHSLDVNQNEYAAVGEGQLEQLGDERGSLIVTPLARGTDTWYLDAGLVDVFEAWRDVRRSYAVDRDRTSLTGYSMGGYLTYRLGLLRPDAFARASVFVGPPIFYHWSYPLPPESPEEWLVRGNTNLLVENGLNLPFEVNHGNADELVPISGVLEQMRDFDAAGNPYRFYHHQADDHFSFIVVADRWGHTRDWLGNEKRVRAPMRVRYVTYPATDLQRAGLRFDGAYWVDRMRVREGEGDDAHASVDATSFALGGKAPVLVEEGTQPYAGPEAVSPAAVTGQHYEEGEPVERRNAFEAELTNLGSVLFRTERMGLDPDRPVSAKLVGDGPTTLRFSGPWPERLSATLDGKPVPATGGPGAEVQVTLTPGATHELKVAPR